MRHPAAALAALLIFAAAGAHAEEGVYKGVGIAMHGAPKYKDGFTHFDYVNPDASKGGSIKIGVPRTFDSLNPFIISGVAAAGVSQHLRHAHGIVSRRTVLGIRPARRIDRGAGRPLLGRLHASPRGAFPRRQPGHRRRRDLHLQHLLAKGAPFFRAYYASVAKVEKTGERTVRFTFKPGDNRELPLILGQLPVLPKAYWEKRDFSKTTLEPPLGSGPYKIDSVDPGRSITYRRVENYWGRNSPTARGTNNFDVIRYDYYRDDTVAREALKAGDLDLRVENQAKAWAIDYSIPEVTDGLLIKKEIPRGAPRRHASVRVQHAQGRCSRTRACARRSAIASISNGPTRTCSTANMSGPRAISPTPSWRRPACRPARS